MFRYIFRRIRCSSLKNENDGSKQGNVSEKKSSEPLLPCLERNLEAIRDALRGSSDLAVHEFNFGHDRRYRGAIVFISDMADKDEINKNILQPLMFGSVADQQRCRYRLYKDRQCGKEPGPGNGQP